MRVRVRGAGELLRTATPVCAEGHQVRGGTGTGRGAGDGKRSNDLKELHKLLDRHSVVEDRLVVLGLGLGLGLPLINGAVRRTSSVQLALCLAPCPKPCAQPPSP